MIINIGSAITCLTQRNSSFGRIRHDEGGASRTGTTPYGASWRSLEGESPLLVEPGPIKTEFMDALSTRNTRGRADAPDPRQRGSWMAVSRGCMVARRIVRLLEHSASAGVGPEAVRPWPFRIVDSLAALPRTPGDSLVIAM